MSYEDLTTRCLLAVVGGARSVREVQRAVMPASLSTVHRHLLILRHNDLVRWEEGKSRTLRPGVQLVGVTHDYVDG